MANDRVGFGLLGAGLVAPFHARALQASEKTRLVAIADTVPERLEKLTKQFGCAGYSSLDEMLKNPEVEAVNVVIPNHLHAQAAIAVARAGRHVLVEKPPAMSLRDLDQMTEACRAAGVHGGVVLQCRTRKAIQAMRTAIQQGRFGKIYHADTYMKWFRATEYYTMDAWRQSRQSGAGVTIQQLFHYIDLLQYLMGPVKRVHARMTNLAHPTVNVDDTTLAFVDYENGAQGVVEASTALWPGTDIRIEINGENGTAIMVGERMETWKFREERPEDEGIRQFGSSAVATGATGAADFDYHDHQVLIEDMADAIRNKREPLIPFASVRPTLEWALSMYASAKRNTPVELPLVDEDSIW